MNQWNNVEGVCKTAPATPGPYWGYFFTKTSVGHKEWKHMRLLPCMCLFCWKERIINLQQDRVCSFKCKHW